VILCEYLLSSKEFQVTKDFFSVLHDDVNNVRILRETYSLLRVWASTIELVVDFYDKKLVVLMQTR